MLAWHHEHVDGRLRVDIPERDRARSLGHDGCRDLPGDDGAKQAVGHGEILTCALSEGLRPYMVALLRTHDAPPLWCTVSPISGCPSPRVRLARELRRGRDWAWGEQLLNRTGQMAEYHKDP